MRRTTRALHGSLAAALAGAFLLTVNTAPAHAAPGFTEVESDPYAGGYLNGGACSSSGASHPSIPAVPITENGAAVTSTATASTTYAADGDPTDTVTTTATIKTTARATSSGGRPTSVTMTYSGTVQSVASKATSACTVLTYAGVDSDFRFTITTPTWATMTATRKGHGYTEVYLYDVNSDGYEDLYGRNLDGTSTSTVYLPAGTYAGYLEAEARTTGGNKTFTASMSGRASLKLAPAGSASAVPAGTAKKHVTLPTARNCGANNAAVKLTTKKKRVKKIERVTYTVNGRKAATLKGKKVRKGRTVALRVPAAAPATIKATVTLKNGKKRTVQATYLACTS